MPKTGLRRRIAQFIDPTSIKQNKYAEAFLSMLGGGFTKYDNNSDNYLEEGYGNNPDVFAIIQQMTTKTVSIPYFIKKVKDEDVKNQLESFRLSTKQNYTSRQYIKSKVLETKAFKEKTLPFPLKNPNSMQTWGDIFALYKTFMRTTGNFYLYLRSPEEGANKGTPKEVYVLPSHMMQIVLKSKVDFLDGESPIDHYMLTEGNQFVTFEAENVIHVKFANPFFDFDGGHLYGLSPLRAALRNIQSSNEAIDNNIKTLQNGGAFGFIHGKQIPLGKEQADELKDRMLEMDSNSGRLSKLTGISSEIGFTRISLTTDELKPFEYLKYDRKAICNVLGWSDTLLNNDEGGKYDKQANEARRVVTDNIMPDLYLLKESLEVNFLPLFKGYENTVIDFDYSELPEMQNDMSVLSKICNDELDRGVISRDEYRAAMRYPVIGTPEMEAHTVGLGIQLLDDALVNDMLDESTLNLDE